MVVLVTRILMNMTFTDKNCSRLNIYFKFNRLMIVLMIRIVLVYAAILSKTHINEEFHEKRSNNKAIALIASEKGMNCSTVLQKQDDSYCRTRKRASYRLST